jgi:hypothetical protein
MDGILRGGSVRLLDGAARRLWLLGVPLGVAAAVAVILLVRSSHAGAGPVELKVEHAMPRPGRIVLVLVNGSENRARVAQVILNDAFVGFSPSARAVEPGGTVRIAMSYQWIPGEAYEIELMTSSGRTVDYGIEDAQSGTQAA